MSTKLSLRAVRSNLREEEKLLEIRARRKYLREQLAGLFKEGDKIRWGIMAGNYEDHRKFDPWLKKVKEFFSQEPEFDHSHIVRFETKQLGAIDDFIKEFADQ